MQINNSKLEILDINNDQLLEIFRNLDLTTLARITAVCRRFRDLVYANDGLWLPFRDKINRHIHSLRPNGSMRTTVRMATELLYSIGSKNCQVTVDHIKDLIEAARPREVCLHGNLSVWNGDLALPIKKEFECELLLVNTITKQQTRLELSSKSGHFPWHSSKKQQPSPIFTCVADGTSQKLFCAVYASVQGTAIDVWREEDLKRSAKPFCSRFQPGFFPCGATVADDGQLFVALNPSTNRAEGGHVLVWQLQPQQVPANDQVVRKVPFTTLLTTLEVANNLLVVGTKQGAHLYNRQTLVLSKKLDILPTKQIVILGSVVVWTGFRSSDQKTVGKRIDTDKMDVISSTVIEEDVLISQLCRNILLFPKASGNNKELKLSMVPHDTKIKHSILIETPVNFDKINVQFIDGQIWLIGHSCLAKISWMPSQTSLFSKPAILHTINSGYPTISPDPLKTNSNYSHLADLVTVAALGAIIGVLYYSYSH